jgi:hypothetical protein
MIKIAIIILFIFTILACNPIQQASQNKEAQPKSPFLCLASQSRCEVSTDSGVFIIEFSGQINGGKIKTELPFEIKLTLKTKMKDSTLKNVSSYLEGKTMFMGKIPVFFQMGEQRKNSIIAESLLVSCSEEVMVWRLWFTVDIEQADQIIKQDFFIDFDSKRL